MIFPDIINPRAVFLRSAILCTLLSSQLFAAGKNILVPVDPESGVKIEIESWLDACPPGGMMPFTLRITNDSKAAHDWTLTTSNGYGGGTSSSFSISVPAGRSAELPFVASAGVNESASYYRMMNLTISGHGTHGFAGNMQQPDTLSKASHTSQTPFLGISAQLSLKGWSALSDKFEKTYSSGSSAGVGLNATQVDMAKAPDDWRGYSGLARLWMTDGEWSSMNAASKSAMLEWIALGGEAVVFTEDDSEARLAGLKIPVPGTDGVRRIGAGKVSLQKWDGKTFPLAEAFKMALDKNAHTLSEHVSGYAGGWKLRDTVATPSFNALLIFGFILLFGIIIGPVNLYWLAKAGRRQRLFWTTPLISVAGSALLMVLMIVQDGIGGSGSRRVLALMLPGQNKLAILQEQVSRTGVLLNRSFPIEEPSWLQQITHDIPGSSYNPVMDPNRGYVENNQTSRSGDWFANRAVQAQTAVAVRPSRGHIEVIPGPGENDPPSVISSLEVPLTNVFIVDDRGRFWRGEQIGTGEKKILKAATKPELQKWADDAAFLDMGPLPGATLRSVFARPGYAYAESAEASKVSVKTLSSIRWNNDRVIFAGPYVKH